MVERHECWRPLGWMGAGMICALVGLVGGVGCGDDDGQGTQCGPGEVPLSDGRCLPACEGEQIRLADESCQDCGDHERAQDNQCVCEPGWMRVAGVCQSAMEPDSDLGTDWHPDPDGDGVVTGEDDCPYVYDPGQDDGDGDGLGDVCDPDFVLGVENGPVTDLVAEHVTPYGAWLRYTSPRSETYGWGGQLVWSEVAADLGGLASVQQVVEGGDAQVFATDAPFGEPPHRPVILTRLEPDTTYYLALVREDWTGLVDEISNVLEIRTLPAPPVILANARPRVFATPALIQSLSERHLAGDLSWTSWYDELSGRVLQAGADPESVYAASAYCPQAAVLFHATGEGDFLDAARVLFEELVVYWEDNELTGNQYRWANANLGVCLDLLWDELTTAERDRAAAAMLADDEHHVFDDPPRFDDTDEFASVTRTQVIHGLALCDASDLDPGLADRGCVVLEAGLRTFYGVQRVKARRDRGFWAQSGGFLPDGSDYGQGTSLYWLQSFWALANAGAPAADYAPWILHNLLSKVVHALSPTRYGYYTQGDVEDFSYNYDLEPSSFQLEDSDSSLIALHQGLLAAGGLTTEATWARGLADALWQPYGGPEALWHLLFDHDASPGTDYRDGLGTAFWDSGLGLFYDRTSWEEEASLLVYRSGWSGVDHSHQDLGHFQLYRAGRWITHEAIAYDGDAATADGHNVLRLQQAMNEGDPDCVCQHLGRGAAPSRVIRASVGSAHTLVTSDQRGCYRSFYYHSDYYDAVQRSLLWLKTDEGGSADYLVVFDLVDSATDAPADLTRQWLLQLDELPALSDNVATVTLVGSAVADAADQQLDVAAVLPTTATLARRAPQGQPDDYPGPLYNHRLIIDANTDAPDLRFVTVLRVGDAPLPVLQTLPIESGDVVGATFGRHVVLFANRPLTWDPAATAAAPITATFTAPGLAAPFTLWIAGLAPAASYDVDVVESGDDLTITLIPGAAHTADRAGLLALTVDASGGVTTVY
jgi:hypothetical protein